MPKPKGRPRAQKPKPVELREDQSILQTVDPAHMRLIGTVAVVWSKLEEALHDLVWALVNISEDDGQILTRRMDVGGLIPIAVALAERHLPEREFLFAHDALDLAELRREDRNFIEHGSWGTLMPDNKPIATSIRPKSPPGTLIAEVFVKERMDEIIKDILDARNRLIWVRQKLLALRAKAAPPLPTGSPSPQSGQQSQQ